MARLCEKGKFLQEGRGRQIKGVNPPEEGEGKGDGASERGRKKKKAFRQGGRKIQRPLPRRKKKKKGRRFHHPLLKCPWGGKKRGGEDRPVRNMVAKALSCCQRKKEKKKTSRKGKGEEGRDGTNQMPSIRMRRGGKRGKKFPAKKKGKKWEKKKKKLGTRDIFVGPGEKRRKPTKKRERGGKGKNEAQQGRRSFFGEKEREKKEKVQGRRKRKKKKKTGGGVQRKKRKKGGAGKEEGKKKRGKSPDFQKRKGLIRFSPKGGGERGKKENAVAALACLE